MFTEMVPLFPAGGIPGGTELIVILLIAVLLFGANKIPKLARSTGQAMGEFQKGREQVEQELEEMQEGADPESESESELESTTAETETASSGSESTTGSSGSTGSGGGE